MGPVRLLRSLVPLVLVAGLAAACGNGSSSQPGGAGSPPGTGVAPSIPGNQLEVRPVYARYATGVQLGPQIPQDLVKTLSSTSCPTKARVVRGMILECDAGKTVFLLRSPIVVGGVASATAAELQKIWYVKVELDSSAEAKLKAALPSIQGSELALSFGGQVLTAPIVDPSFATDHLAIIGNFDQKTATKLAAQISGA
jgi:hypothetical protein